MEIINDQQNPPQNPLQNQGYYNYQNQPNTHLSVGRWFLTLFILSIPLLNIIMLFVWAAGDPSDERKNFAKANLLWIVVVIAICFLIIGCIGGIGVLANQY